MIAPDKRNSANKKKLGRSNPPRASPRKTEKNKGRNDILHDLTGNIAADMKRLLIEPADWFRRLDKKKWFLMNVPYILIGCAADKIVWLYRNSYGITALDKVLDTLNRLDNIFGMPIISIYYQDILYGIAGGVLVKVIVYYRTKNAKKYRKGEEYGSARWDAYYLLKEVFYGRRRRKHYDPIQQDYRAVLPSFSR